MFHRDEAAIIGLFPNREFGAGSAPSIHHVGVASLSGCHPFEEIEDQRFYGCVGHEIVHSRVISIYRIGMAIATGCVAGCARAAPARLTGHASGTRIESA